MNGPSSHASRVFTNDGICNRAPLDELTEWGDLGTDLGTSDGATSGPPLWNSLPRVTLKTSTLVILRKIVAA